jgi:hypothetical protein
LFNFLTIFIKFFNITFHLNHAQWLRFFIFLTHKSQIVSQIRMTSLTSSKKFHLTNPRSIMNPTLNQFRILIIHALNYNLNESMSRFKIPTYMNLSLSRTLLIFERNLVFLFKLVFNLFYWAISTLFFSHSIFQALAWNLNKECLHLIESNTFVNSRESFLHLSRLTPEISALLQSYFSESEFVMISLNSPIGNQLQNFFNLNFYPTLVLESWMSRIRGSEALFCLWCFSFNIQFLIYSLFVFLLSVAKFQRYQFLRSIWYRYRETTIKLL